MTIKFSKYQGTGNDFVMVEDLDQQILPLLSKDTVKNICDRKFGVGADGFILLVKKDAYDFEMVYYNSDGNPSTMCGNGGRCAVAFAKQKGLIGTKANFLAVDGPHHAYFINDSVALQMQNVTSIKTNETFYQLNTGSPHYIAFVEDVNDINVAQEGALIRNSPLFKEEGINVNFVHELADDKLFVRTYERGVEDETLSCGTGVTAAALVQMMRKKINEIQLETLGGALKVKATKNETGFEHIELIGPAQFVFEGAIDF